ncbi:hypothetical protein [Amorphus orientalis]|uniref:Uncharacterized protein n=1 Tax=Amorphus orientalis TaxID=649198 RepID=A0AAE3VTC0_9HYPH|nr:hypothetical protein [Amorphus orientalis]MDQ0317761.1 hypothetical protein [Amorphus orientalis]
MHTDEMTDQEFLAYRGLQAAQNLAHDTAVEAGWYQDPATGLPIERNFGEVIALMHSELSEALEADRKSLKDDKLTERDGREVEYADFAIRVLDTAAARNCRVPSAFIAVTRLLQDFSLQEVRFALAIFHMLDSSGSRDLDVAGATIEKNRFNQGRADHKPENRANGGKAY